MPNRTDCEAAKRISEILKQVDMLVKSDDLPGARQHILQAKDLDPKNMYAHAYLERIELLLEQQKRNNEAAETRRRAEEIDRRKHEEEQLKREEEIVRILRAQRSLPRPLQKRNHAADLASYNRAVFEAWKSGVPSRQDELHLLSLCRTLEINPEEHEELTKIVQREGYIQAFKGLWLSSDCIADGPGTITALRRQYGIRPGESDSLELEVLALLKKPASGPRAVIIDDDEDFLKALTIFLRDEGFEVSAFATSDEAYQFLLTSTPDIILSDINLETSTIGGFGFFERIQLLPRLSTIPFVFLSGLTDEVVIRAGKELGADDFLAKPFDGAKLLSVIKGKLRRYGELQSVSRN